MNTDPVIYQEKKTSKLIIIVLSLFALYFGFSYFYQGVLKLGPIGTRPAPDHFYLGFAIFMILCLFAFKTLTITITTAAVIIGFNKFITHRIKFQDIAKITLDDKFYGGIGLRVRLVKGKLRIAYNVGSPRVVISLKNKGKEIAFSTDQPEQVIKIIEGKYHEEY